MKKICVVTSTKEEYAFLHKIIENLNNPNVSISDVRIKNPNNPVQLMDGKLLVFRKL